MGIWVLGDVHGPIAAYRSADDAEKGMREFRAARPFHVALHVTYVTLHW